METAAKLLRSHNIPYEKIHESIYWAGFKVESYLYGAQIAVGNEKVGDILKRVLGKSVYARLLNLHRVHFDNYEFLRNGYAYIARQLNIKVEKASISALRKALIAEIRMASSRR